MAIVFNRRRSPALPLLTPTYLDEDSSESDLSTYTFSAMALGDAAADRTIIASVALVKSGGAATISSVTVAGNAAASQAQATTGNQRGALYSLDLASGTTGDVVVTLSATSARCGVLLWNFYGGNKTASDTISDTATPLTGTIDVTKGGCIIGQALSTDGPPYVWSGMTKDFEGAIGGSSTDYTGASDVFTAADTGKTITCAPNASDSGATLVVAAFDLL